MFNWFSVFSMLNSRKFINFIYPLSSIIKNLAIVPSSIWSPGIGNSFARFMVEIFDWITLILLLYQYWMNLERYIYIVDGIKNLIGMIWILLNGKSLHYSHCDIILYWCNEFAIPQFYQASHDVALAIKRLGLGNWELGHIILKSFQQKWIFYSK